MHDDSTAGPIDAVADPGQPPAETTAAGHQGVIVTGMHRSGTSLVASLVEDAGISMGDRQLPADRHNPRGYFEDIELLTLQREMLAAATREDDGGHRDWGWTEGEQVDAAVFASYRDRARALVDARAARGRPWGWKDPRTTLLLDFWQPLLPAARHVLVYRQPWEVADSMQRLGADVFLRHPLYAYRIWAFYNARLLDFYTRHRDRCLLVCSAAVRRRPGDFVGLLRQRIGLELPASAVGKRLDPELLRSPAATDPLIDWITAAHPECRQLLADLDALADLSATGLWQTRPPRAPRVEGSRVSVVIPCRDHGELLLEAVGSAQQSIEEPFELIVVDDGSTEPRTLAVMALLRDAGCTVVTQAHGGLAAARNHGIALARGPYVLPLDADNRLRPGFAGAAVAVLEAQPEVGVVYPEREEFGLRSGRAGVPAFDLPAVLTANYVDACVVMRKQVWSDAAGFDGAMPSPGWEDWDLWLSAIERGWRFHYLPEAVFDYRVRPGSMITAFADPAQRLATLRYVLTKHQALYMQHLPEILLFAQGLTSDLWRTGRALEAAERARARTQQTFQALREVVAGMPELAPADVAPNATSEGAGSGAAAEAAAHLMPKP